MLERPWPRRSGKMSWNWVPNSVVDAVQSWLEPEKPCSNMSGSPVPQTSAPAPAAGSFNEEAAKQGKLVFAGKAKCASCHVPPLFTEPGWNMHTPAEVCVDDFQANRAPDKRYRTSPLNGLWTHTKGGFYHDGRFATLADVVNHYDVCSSLGLSDKEKSELVEFLKSLPPAEN
jgi:cytochrome c peroxidase